MLINKKKVSVSIPGQDFYYALTKCKITSIKTVSQQCLVNIRDELNKYKYPTKRVSHSSNFNMVTNINTTIIWIFNINYVLYRPITRFQFARKQTRDEII